MAQPTYHLWLDESGNFQEDARETRSGPSLVGGVWCDEATARSIVPANILDLVRNEPAFQSVLTGVEQKVICHATELPREIKTPARAAVIQACARLGMDFVFFRNPGKIRIQDSTRTYLNFLAEGLAQFMAHLSMRGPAHLEVTIGYRKDMAAYEAALRTNPHARKSDIPEEEYIPLIEERIALARARYLFDSTNQISYHIGFAHDKKNTFLVLSDYVCNGRFALDSTDRGTRRNLERPSPSGPSYREVIEKEFQLHGMTFGLWEDRCLLDIRSCLSNRSWGSALYLALSKGVPDHQLHQELAAGFAPMNEQGQRAQLDVFFHLTDHLAQADRDHQTVISLLEAFLRYLDRIDFKFPETKVYCAVNARLYLGAAYSHTGRAARSQELLDQCEVLLPALLRRPENWPLYYILRNREVINLQDCFDYAGALAMLDEALCVTELEQDNLRQLYAILSYSFEGAASEQRARLLGSRALTLQYMLASAPERGEEARNTAKQAIAAFAYPEDRRRHQMTLAEIELRLKNTAAALDAFLSGMGCGGDELSAALLRSTSGYDWYHAINLADRLLDGNDAQRRLGQELFVLIRSNFTRIFQNAYPAHSAARRAGQVAWKAGAGRKASQGYYTLCERLCFQSEHLTGPLWGIGLASIADRLASAEGGPSTVPALEERFRGRLQEALDSDLSPRLRAFYQPALDRLQQRGADAAFYQSFADRVGH